ncbi:MAG: hypothetical protein NZ930_07630 [Candidatus Bipolaricaulota bacterium]|nr:hypothetical protein [Candidatus Bipolaricaulota bacterium]MDW8030339.1 hypothetical protein [Candidatus Bipolaricaulota bacterium]
MRNPVDIAMTACTREIFMHRAFKQYPINGLRVAIPAVYRLLGYG